MELFKRINLKDSLKVLLLNSDGVSRREAAGKTGLDVRTVSAYMEEFSRQGLVYEKTVQAAGKGRPSVLYYPNSENLAFIGLVLRAESLSYCVCDTKGNPFCSTTESFDPESETKFSTVKRIFEKIDLMRKSALLKNKSAAGIGISISRWLRPPLSAFDLYSDITNIVERETGLGTFSSTPINAALYHIRNISEKFTDMLVIHPGIVLELGIMRAGSIPENAHEIEESFSHFSVDAGGAGCYCGKKGCLEHYVVNNAVKNILHEEMEKDGICESITFADGLARKKAAFLRTADKVSLFLAKGISELCRLYNPDSINLLDVPDYLYQAVLKNIRHISRGKVPDFSFFREIDIARASALMASFETVRNFINTGN